MKVDICDEPCLVDQKICGAPKPTVESLYIRIIEAPGGCAYAGQESVSRTSSAFPDTARIYRSCQVPNSGSIVAIVDDDKAVGNAIEVLMRSVGLIAKAFSSGEEFLRSPELSRTGCLVVDFDMPRMSGLDLHNNLSRSGKEIPTVLITAYPSDDIRARALRAGVICYLPKPFDESDLLNCIRTALDHAKGAP